MFQLKLMNVEQQLLLLTSPQVGPRSLNSWITCLKNGVEEGATGNAKEEMQCYQVVQSQLLRSASL